MMERKCYEKNVTKSHDVGKISLREQNVNKTVLWTYEKCVYVKGITRSLFFPFFVLIFTLPVL